MEAALGVAARTLAVVVAPVLPPETFDRRPRLDQRAVDREVIARQQLLHLRLRQHGCQELRRDLALQQPVAVLGESRVIPDRIIYPKSNKPAEQQVELQALHQLALGADSVEGLQQHRPKQLLRRNRWPPKIRIKRRERPRQIAQCRVRNLPDRPQRMIAANTRLQVHITEQRSRPLVRSAHPTLPIQSNRENHLQSRPARHFFNSLLGQERAAEPTVQLFCEISRSGYENSPKKSYASSQGTDID